MNILKLRKLWYTISILLVGSSIAFLSVFHLNLGLDFSGGIRMQFQFENKPDIQKIENFFSNKVSEGVLEKTAKIQQGASNELLITIEEVQDQVFQSLKKEFTTTFSVEVSSLQRISSSIGKSFQKKAIWAILWSLVGIMIFVGISFRSIPKSVNPWRFGVVAIAALFHDILILLGVFVLLGKFTGLELDLQFITAMLATLGFSVNDTIVILDRIRENIRREKTATSFEQVAGISVEQTLRRSLNTSISTLLPLFALLFFGTESIFYFVLALIIGISVGTYSSIFIATPLLVDWKKWQDK